MKRTTIYLIITIAILLLIAAFVLYQPTKTFDKKVTFSYKEPRPYATRICFTTLPLMFNNPKVIVNIKAPYEWMYEDSIKEGGRLLFIISKQFNPNKNDLDWMYSFVSNGNYIFISTFNINETAREYLKLDFDYNYSPTNDDDLYDSVKVKLIKPLYSHDSSYFNAGFTTEKYISKYDSTNFISLGLNHKNNPNFIKASVNNGAFFLHTDPFLFSNYFLLQKHNEEYYQKVLSAVPNNVTKIIWDDYFTYKKDDINYKSHAPLRILFQYPSFVWAISLAIGLFIIYLLIHVKRKQRFVSVIEGQKNDSLYFAETIGRLYFEKGDHINLAKKMAAYFLEHIRSKYLINTSQLNNELVSKISAKSGYSEEETHNIIQSIANIQVQDSIDQNQLNIYYTQFQNFYKHTL